jgi:hypothetical protein
MHKLDALQKLKSGNVPFVKFPSGNIPLQTSFNPTVYGYLWPTLFPYGIGMFEHPIRLEKAQGLWHIDMKSHVSHLLHLSDKHFQTHITFIFVMMNIIQ